MAVSPSWLIQVQRSVSRWLEASRAVTVTVTSRVSPMRTGARNCRVWPTYSVPGPGRRVPSSAEISAAPHMPWAITPLMFEEAANSWSTWVGLTSPDITANSWMSSAVRVRWRLAQSPTAISSKVRLRSGGSAGGDWGCLPSCMEGPCVW